MLYNRATQGYVVLLVATALICLFLTYSQPNFQPTLEHFWLPLIIFSVIAFFTQIYEVTLVFNRAISTSVAIFIATLLLGGAPLAVGVLTLSGLVAEIVLRSGLFRANFGRFVIATSFNTAQMTVATFAAALIFAWLGQTGILPRSGYELTDTESILLILAGMVAFFAFSLANNTLVSGMISLVANTSFTYHIRFNVRHLLVQILTLGVLGVLLAEVYSAAPGGILLVLIPMGLVHASLRNYMNLRHEAQTTFENVANMLAERDPYTYEHSEQVEDLAGKVAEELHLSQDQIESIQSGALIHDIGKLAVPDRILLKPGPLTPEERKEMEKHPVIGAELLSNLEIYKDIVEIVRHEHEKWDGTGYPDSIAGEEIPLGARIIAAADIYNALTTDRPYRKAYSHQKAVEIIRDMRGSHLDPNVVDALLAVLGEIEHAPIPLMERVWQTALPFSPVVILLLLIIVSVLP
jgi:putative nucleotidyltransferase with HDIG domain